ncbi:uncharacterized protein LOC112591875 [Melanaphis sacchari]|uniref:uncharacterized protein LOC112591875 n=1 Tax=Melanaphis sacchari TaxID=742174 RepID=UPI000DC156C0|nr:uncharacterized protein LOC112591875 [Melanaphis sacchari]
MRLCGLNKPILPVMPEEGEVLKFKGGGNMQRHPFVIYADFEALLKKQTERVGASTDGIHAHHPMSYGYFVKAAVDVPVALMEKYDIPQTPVVYRGSESRYEVAKHFIASVTALTIRLGNLLKATNVSISMGVEELRAHNAKSVCDMFDNGDPQHRGELHLVLEARHARLQCKVLGLVSVHGFEPGRVGREPPHETRRL